MHNTYLTFYPHKLVVQENPGEKVGEGCIGCKQCRRHCGVQSESVSVQFHQHKHHDSHSLPHISLLLMITHDYLAREAIYM